MAVEISYMGTKRALAPTVADVVSQCRDGTFLDAFSGMCAVGGVVSESRQVWANDIQVFAANVAEALFVAPDAVPDPIYAAELVFDTYIDQRAALENIVRRDVDLEIDLHASESFVAFEEAKARLDERILVSKRVLKSRGNNLFLSTYAGSYFGVSQCIEIDAIVFALRVMRDDLRITQGQHRWMVISLGRAMLRVSNSTGHFAQYLTPNERTFKRFIRQRSRSVWVEWVSSLGVMCPYGDKVWRKKNKAFNADSAVLLKKISSLKNRPSVIYADPPYSDDQYSRFYHILETLVLYDYPSVSGVGRYREDRFRAKFSLVAQASEAMDVLAAGAARCKADLVLSYPSNGLVYKAGGDPISILRRHFKRVDCVVTLSHSHSTFGASKGRAQNFVDEQIFLARA